MQAQNDLNQLSGERSSGHPRCSYRIWDRQSGMAAYGLRGGRGGSHHSQLQGECEFKAFGERKLWE